MNSSTYKLLTDALVLFHFAFVTFVVLGGLLALRWRWVAFLHLPAVVWVIYAEATSTLCPLTPMENRLREKAGITTYEGGFVDHYIMPVLYPEGLTPDTQMTIAIVLLVLSATCYGLIVTFWFRRWRARRQNALRASATPAAVTALSAPDATSAEPMAVVTPDNGTDVVAVPPAR